MGKNNLDTNLGNDRFKTQVEEPDLDQRTLVKRVQESFSVFASNRGALVSAVVILIAIVVAVSAPILAPHSPSQFDVGPTLQSPSRLFPMGTDQFGRDVLSRVIYGTRLALLVPLVAEGIGCLIGLVIGLVAGYVGGWLDRIILRVIDIMMAFPGLLLTLVIVTLLGPGVFNVQVAVGISLIPVFARMVRGEVLSLKETQYVEAARSIGCKPWQIIFGHILPNLITPTLVLATATFTWAILIGVSMNFLGLGIKPPTPDWGADLSLARNYIRNAWWLSTFPGIALTVLLLAINLFGDGLQQALDPRLRTRRG